MVKELLKGNEGQKAVNGSRRDLLQKAAVGSILLAAGAMLPGCGGSGSGLTTGSVGGDIDILNFALNLEYLESEFYTYATTGSGIASAGVGITGVGASGATTGGVKTVFSDSTTQAVAMEIAADEREHVTFIRTTLDGAQVAKPAINLAALGIDFSNQTGFLILARAFEDVGISAYGGAAPAIQSKVYLGAAARILAAEALHTGNLRLLIAQQGIHTTAVDSQDILPPPSGPSYLTLDSTNALSVIRTTRQVLDIVYGAVGAANGGFFPNGFNGNITK